jgi:transcriptional regulator with XRE-family HTH domain
MYSSLSSVTRCYRTCAGKGSPVSGRNYDERKVQPLDTHVGRRIRMRRTLLGLSQENLAESVGVTFQQIQKYERGANRVSASRLHQLGEVLGVRVDYFYQEYNETGGNRPRGGLSDSAQQSATGDDRLYTRETLDLLKVYYSVKDHRKRKELLKIIRSMVENMRVA